MLLPWGQVTVIEQVVTTFRKAGIDDILVVTGGAHEQMKETLDNLAVRKTYNKEYATGEMLSSLQHGLQALPQQTEAALIALGDQPQIEEDSIRLICDAYAESKSRLIVPSFKRKRGHPWLVARNLWEELLALEFPATLRDFLNVHSDEIHYIDVLTPTILADLDTPEDYRSSHP